MPNANATKSLASQTTDFCLLSQPFLTKNPLKRFMATVHYHGQSKSKMLQIEYKIYTMTIADACTNWVELALIPTANSKSCAIQCNTNWLYHYL